MVMMVVVVMIQITARRWPEIAVVMMMVMMMVVIVILRHLYLRPTLLGETSVVRSQRGKRIGHGLQQIAVR
jgi:hypothetical protein